MKKARPGPNYGNWVPRRILYIQGAVAALCITLALCVQVIPLRILFFTAAVLCAGVLACFCGAYRIFSYGGGGLSGKILDMVVSHIKWDGQGDALDIGCGSGALSIKAAKKFPGAKITGIDYWGTEWDYNKRQCEQNAALEGVSDRIVFLKGDAAQLPFGDEHFDMVVSNFTFHEVKSAKNKRDPIKEALRILKKGGVFVFHDLFYAKKLYGDPDALLAELRALGISEIAMKSTAKLEILPRFLRGSLALGKMGLIYGKK